jgi:hypothetical protein
MDHGTQEITRVYRLDFNFGEPEWDDPMPHDVTSEVLGRRAMSTINRTSLLAWSLMNLPCVEVADLTLGGWMKVVISSGSNFDEPAFKTAIAEIVQRVRDVRCGQGHRRASTITLGRSGATSSAARMLERCARA